MTVAQFVDDDAAVVAVLELLVDPQAPSTSASAVLLSVIATFLFNVPPVLNPSDVQNLASNYENCIQFAKDLYLIHLFSTFRSMGGNRLKGADRVVKPRRSFLDNSYFVVSRNDRMGDCRVLVSKGNLILPHGCIIW